MSSLVTVALALSLALLAGLLVASLARTRRAMRRFQILSDLAEVSDGDSSVSDTLDAISAVLVPEFADFCMIDVIGEEGIERARVRVGPGADPEVERGLAEREPSLPSNMVDSAGSASSEPRFFERMREGDLRELAHDDASDLDFLRSLRIRSAITVALKARGRRTGALTVGVAWSGRRYRHGNLRFAQLLSGRVALALDNAGLFSDLKRAERARAEIAQTLQRGLLPPPLPEIPGWSAAAMYRPAGAENEVGGDFYDAFQVAGGWMLVIGDVTGRGAEAASITAQARYTLRTAAVLTGDPLVALATLNRALLTRSDASLCSVAAIAFSEDSSQSVRVAVAGHPPPLLVDGESVTEVAHSGPVLGAMPGATWHIEHALIGPGQQLVLVTDGIIEASGKDDRFGEERLRSELAGTASPARVVQQLESALHAFSDGAFEDDATILAIAPALVGADLEVVPVGSSGGTDG
jgi:serine phosphatase RsbU (regulator of sigma subunit)